MCGQHSNTPPSWDIEGVGENMAVPYVFRSNALAIKRTVRFGPEPVIQDFHYLKEVERIVEGKVSQKRTWQEGIRKRTL